MKARNAYLGMMIVALSSTTPMAWSAVADTASDQVSMDAGLTLNYWSPEQLQQLSPAVPVKAGAVMAGDTITEAVHSDVVPAAQIEEGHKPTFSVTAITDNYIVQPTGNNGAEMVVAEANEQITEAIGNLGMPFTSAKVFPLKKGAAYKYSADLAYPYRTVGRLFFTMDGANYSCTATVVKPRVILTAGHCVHNGNGNPTGWATNFLFVPAYRDGNAPFGVWAGVSAVTTQSWYNGGGAVPNAADYALITIADAAINNVAHKLGDVTGWLGVKTYAAYPNHVHIFGYPSNFDNGEKMHEVTSGSLPSSQVSDTNVEYGGDMAGGASGGPWIQNFGPGKAANSGQDSGGKNTIVGVTSYSAAPGEPLMGSSVLTEQYTELLTQVCSLEGNC